MQTKTNNTPRGSINGQFRDNPGDMWRRGLGGGAPVGKGDGWRNSTVLQTNITLRTEEINFVFIMEASVKVRRSKSRLLGGNVVGGSE